MHTPYEAVAVLELHRARSQDNDADILVAGDSMMRQIFSRLVQMMRGQQRILDCE